MIVKIKKKDKGFSQISNALLDDNRLTLRSRGLVCYLLSKPDDWKVSVDRLVASCLEGRDAIQGCFKELKEFGYAELCALKDENGNFIGKQWVIHEEPIIAGRPEKRPVRSSTDGLKSGPSENRTVGKSDREIQTQKITKTDKEKERGESGEKKSPPPAPLTENQETENTSALEAKNCPIPPVAPAPLSPRHSDKPQNLETDTDLFKQIGEYYKANPNEWTDGVCRVLPGRYNNMQLKSMLEEYAGYAFAWKNKYATFAQHHAEFKRWVKRQPTMQKEQAAPRPENNPNLPVYR